MNPTRTRLQVTANLILVTALASSAMARQRPARDDGPPLTWDTLEQRVEEAVSKGFSGTVLVARQGEVVFHKAYGMTDRAQGIANTPDTIYGVGSTPIDFTRAGILLLAQEGKVRLSDPITKYVDDVPPDKRTITIDHLMSGASGLLDFHGLPSDRDPDHHYIDRDAAVRRIMKHKLLFEPGTGDEHSHSAWGLVAAIIEIASGQTYQQFTRERFFEPFGMTDTGFYGEPVAPERMALGYGPRSDGTINAPPYWGEVSWLVMGSGGMVSNPKNLYRWNQAIRHGDTLNPEWRAEYFSPPGGIFAGGDMYGYEMFSTEGPGSLFILCSNAGEKMPVIRSLARALHGLVTRDVLPKFSLGVQMEISEEGVEISRVVPGSAAERDGLKDGDQLVSINGTPIEDDPMAVLDPLLRTGAAIRFGVLRDGERLDISVTPNPR